jgi:ribosomal protein L7/L12
MAFTVRIQSSGSRKIETIKHVREILGCGLKDAKDLVDAAPFALPAGPDRDAAEEIAARFRTLDLPVEILEGDRVLDAAEPLAGNGPFHVVVDDIGTRKIQVIKTVREITQLDLLSAKDLVDRRSFPLGVELDRDGAEHVVTLLAEAGATARAVSGIAGAKTEPTRKDPPARPPPSKMGPMPY